MVVQPMRNCASTSSTLGANRMAIAQKRNERRRRELDRRAAVLELARRHLDAGGFEPGSPGERITSHLLRLERWRALRRKQLVDAVEQAVTLATLEGGALDNLASASRRLHALERATLRSQT